MIEIVEASFLTSAPTIKLAPTNDLQNEVVFMARSNSGKSSLLNALTNRKSLAKVSSSPGKTRLINYFDVTFIDRENSEKNQAVFVDLPGFGYARVSKSIKNDWEKNLTQFISVRENIAIFIHLIDARHTNLAIDKSVSEFLLEACRPNQVILEVFTKIDKLNQKEKGKLRRDFPDALFISSTKKVNLKVLNKRIYKVLFEDNLNILEQESQEID